MKKKGDIQRSEPKVTQRKVCQSPESDQVSKQPKMTVFLLLTMPMTMTYPLSS